MSVRLPPRDAPPIRELLTRATWADLDRISARYNVVVTGRRRELVVERLAALLERPEQLRAAESKLNLPARAVFGLLMLLGSVDDERVLAAARDRLVAIRPEFQATLGRSHLPNELQTLTSLALCFQDRRRVMLPAEVLQALPQALPVATAAPDPDAPAQSYAVLAYKLGLLLDALAEESPVAVQTQRGATDRVTVYQPLLLTPDTADELGKRVGAAPADVTLLLSLLEAIGAVVAHRGRWTVQPKWHSLADHPPHTLMSALVTAWQEPRPLTDVGRTGSYVWRCAPDVECGLLAAQHEASLRTIIWRWLRWMATTPVTINSLCQTLVALHPWFFEVGDERELWLAPVGQGGGKQQAIIEAEPVAQAIVREQLHQLALLGLVVADDASCVLTPLALALLNGVPVPPVEPAIMSIDATTLLVHPFAVSPNILRQLYTAGKVLPPHEEYVRFRLEPRGITELQSQGVSIAELEHHLIVEGAALKPDFLQQLHEWRERAGRVRLHRPLTVLLTAEDAPLAQILAAAGLTNAAEILGPGCALVEPDAVDAAVAQLRMRGFWPTIVGQQGRV